MIIMISGKPRGGKSLRGVGLLAEELEIGRRPIVTTLALKRDELQEYMHSRGVFVNVFDRVTTLDPEQAIHFWRYRGYGVELDPTGNPTAPLDLAPVYDETRLNIGTFYVLDEIHLTFNSRWWQKVTAEAVWYFSQHGKLGDDVIGIAQRLGSVEVQFRELAQEYRFVRNRRMERFGRFSTGNGFEEAVYYREPGKNSMPAQVNRFRLDVKGLAACYNTQAGVGIGDRAGGDKGKKVRGLPLWSMWVGLAAGFVALWIAAGYFPTLLRGMTRKVVKDIVPVGRTAARKASGLAPRRSDGAGRAGTDAPPLAGGFPSPRGGGRGEGGQPQTSASPGLYVRGYVVRGTKVNVVLSDGRTLSELDGELAAVRRNFVRLKNGTKLYFYDPIAECREAIKSPTPE